MSFNRGDKVVYRREGFAKNGVVVSDLNDQYLKLIRFDDGTKANIHEDYLRHKYVAGDKVFMVLTHGTLIPATVGSSDNNNEDEYIILEDGLMCHYSELLPMFVADI